MLAIKETATHLRIQGSPAELDRLSDAFKFRPNGFQYAPSYERWRVSDGDDGWDGYIRPLQRFGAQQGQILRGYKADILRWASRANVELDTRDLLPLPYAHLTLDDIPPDCICADFELDDSQRSCILSWLQHGMGVNQVTVSGGKCLGKGTPVMLHNGSTKPVEQVVAGDLLMGPDSKPRRVLATCVGTGEMYRVDQANGDSYVCNDVHLLAVQRFNASGNHRYGHRKYSTTATTITARDWVALPDSSKENYKGYKVGVEFKHKSVPVDPYFLGLWLGDGTSANPDVTTGDAEIVQYLYTFASENNLQVRAYRNSPNCATYCLHAHTPDKHTSSRVCACGEIQAANGYCLRCYDSARRAGSLTRTPVNALRKAMIKLGVLGNKQAGIPRSYLVNSREVRQQLLAGLIDSDGHVCRSGRIEIVSIHEKLASDICWLARSLGLACKVVTRSTVCQTGAVGLAYRITMSGDMHDVPNKLTRKKTGKQSRCNALRTRLSVVPIGVGDYYGFELDGDGLFLLGDFTVTHNTALFAGAAAIIKASTPKARFLYVTPSERLVRQAAKSMREFLPDWDIGQCGGGHKDFDAKDMVVCTVAMLNRHFRELDNTYWFRTFSAVLVDECHHAPSATAKKILLAIPAFFRFGASDSLKQDDPAKHNAIKGLLGNALNTVSSAPLMEIGRIARPHIYVVDKPEWKDRFRSVPYRANPGSPAFVLVDGVWTRATYLGPVYQKDDQGNLVTRTRKGTELLENGEWNTVTEPVVEMGVHRVKLNGQEQEVSSDYCLLERCYDRSIIQFKERNDLIVQWARYYSGKGYPTVVVCTRTMHVYILETLLRKALPHELVRVLIGDDSPKERDAAFAWLKQTPGAVLVTPLVKEGVSINEIRAGIVADYVSDWEVANQIIGRFIRQKFEGDNIAEITWFCDQQHPVLQRGCEKLFTNLKRFEQYTFYRPAPELPKEKAD